MNWELLRREWGAVAFVITVLIGLVVVPVTLFVANQSPTSQFSTTSEATAARTASPVPSPAPSQSP